MSERSGLGLVETAVLLSMRRATLRPDAVFTRCDRIVEAAFEQFGVERVWAYEALCELARPWSVPLPLVDFGGSNVGSRDFGAAQSTYTRARLSPAGALTLTAEEGDAAPLPIGLINGDVHVDGRHPPFRVTAAIAALLALVENPSITDDDLVDIVGGPVFPGGCAVEGDFDAFRRGERCELLLTARLSAEPEHHAVVISNLPPQVDSQTLTDLLDPTTPSWSDDADWPYDQLEPVGLTEVRNISHGHLADPDTEKVACVFGRGVDLHAAMHQLRTRWGVSTRVVVELGESLPALLRQWVQAHSQEDLAAGLARLDAIA